MKAFNPNRIADKLKALEFYDLGAFNEGNSGVFWSDASDWSPWEMHPDCEELLHIIEGSTLIEILPSHNEETVSVAVNSGEFITIPKGLWHRQKLLVKTKEYYLTPGQTLHSDSKDPRFD